MRRILIIISLIAFICAVTASAFVWTVALRPNVDNESEKAIIIPTGSSFDELSDILNSSGVMKNHSSFVLTARLKRFERAIKPGYYILRSGMSNNQVINTIRSGRQTPVNVTFNNIRTLGELAGKIGGQIEADSSSIIKFLSDESNYADEGFSRETVISVFIPDTYQFYWTTDAAALFGRMLREYNSFWNDERKAAAAAIKLSPVEVSILASIVDDEVMKEAEKPAIAGVYLNRLRAGMHLGACPTIKFALNDFTIRRVLYEHLTIDSPYNTYKYTGLPPGPVRCPTKSGLEAVLNAEDHDYFYFEAKADFSQTHHFSRTLAEHNRYADEYQRELNRRRIYR